MSIRVGIVGISGFSGGEAMRLVAGHPSFELVYAAGEGSAGSRLGDRFPGLPAQLAELVIEKWDPAALPQLDVLFASLPTGASAEALAHVPEDVKIVDIGGDHRYVEGWAYGLADVWPDQIVGQTRVANPGCFPRRGSPAPDGAAVTADSAIPRATRTWCPTAQARPHGRDGRDDRATEWWDRSRTGVHAPSGADDPRRPGHHLLPRPRHH